MGSGNKYMVAAFIATWVIQLGYVLILALKWNSQRSRISR